MAKARAFTISTDRIGPKRWWRVTVHPTVEGLRRAARRYRPDSKAWVEAWGLCQPTSYRVGENGECHYPSSGFAGVVRLTDELLIPEIVAHELVHAATATFRMNVDRDGVIGNNCDEPEESLAYIYGELFADVHDKLEAL